MDEVSNVLTEDVIYYILYYITVGACLIFTLYFNNFIFKLLNKGYEIPVPKFKLSLLYLLIPPLTLVCVIGSIQRLITTFKIQKVDISLYNNLIQLYNNIDNGRLNTIDFMLQYTELIEKYKKLKS